MAALPAALDKLVNILARLPGVGERSAARYAFFLLGEDGLPTDLAQALTDVAERVRFCDECHALAEESLCRVCMDGSRDQDLLCVVESVQDLMAFERSGAFRGLYHVLHGVLSPLKGVGPAQLRLGNLETRINDRAVREVIVATNPDVEGEATALYLARRVHALGGVSITRIATGVPMGSDLEYIDQTTLARALEGRVALN